MTGWEPVEKMGPKETLERTEQAGRHEPVSRVAFQKGSVAVDLDGVISQYEGDPHARPGDPMPGAVEAIRTLRQQGYYIVVFSCRREDHVTWYLDNHGIPYDQVVAGPDKKPIYRVLVDDRAITFDGDWPETVRQIKSFQPYWRRD